MVPLVNYCYPGTCLEWFSVKTQVASLRNMPLPLKCHLRPLTTLWQGFVCPESRQINTWVPSKEFRATQFTKCRPQHYPISSIRPESVPLGGGLSCLLVHSSCLSCRETLASSKCRLIPKWKDTPQTHGGHTAKYKALNLGLLISCKASQWTLLKVQRSEDQAVAVWQSKATSWC